jgi:hypothetical protein
MDSLLVFFRGGGGVLLQMSTVTVPTKKKITETFNYS